MCRFLYVLCEFQSKRGRFASPGSLRSLCVRTAPVRSLNVQLSFSEGETPLPTRGGISPPCNETPNGSQRIAPPFKCTKEGGLPPWYINSGAYFLLQCLRLSWVWPAALNSFCILRLKWYVHAIFSLGSPAGAKSCSIFVQKQWKSLKISKYTKNQSLFYGFSKFVP